MARELKKFKFLFVSRKTGSIQIEKEFVASDGDNMTALSRAILVAKKWAKENGFVLKSS